MVKKLFITDIETNNLYQHVDKFHCAWIIDAISKEKWGFRPHQLKEYCDALSEADVVIGHNIVDFDLPTLKKLNGSLTIKSVFDTLVLSRMLEPDRIQGHSLDSWGQALGVLKGDFGKQENAWEVFTEDMYTYCEQDVEVTLRLFNHLSELAGFDPTDPPSSVIHF